MLKGKDTLSGAVDHGSEMTGLEHNDEMNVFLEVTGQRPVSGSGPIFLIDGNNVELTCGFTSFPSYYDGQIHPEFDDLNLKLWKSFYKMVTKWGAQWYMMGQMASQIMAEMEAYLPDYYKTLKILKYTLDPKCILSRGKFNFWGEKH